MVRSDTIEEQQFRARQWALRQYGQEVVGAPRRNNPLPTPPNEEATAATPPPYTVGDYNIRQNLREERQRQPQGGYTKRRKSLRKKHRRNQKQNFYRVLQSLYYINI